MKNLLLLIACAFIFASSVVGQERITKMMAGPSGDRFKVLVTFTSITDEGYKLQSLIFDVNRVKKNELPNSFNVDLTSTLRSLADGSKKQKILVLRWERPGEIEVKCEGARWTKQLAGAEIDKITETVKAVLQNAPVDAKQPSEFTLPNDVQQKVLAILDGLETSNLQCVRNGS